MNMVLFVASLAIGAGITYVDSRPNWDDTGVTVAAILVSCGILGAAGPSRPWLWALAVGLWIPLLGIACTATMDRCWRLRSPSRAHSREWPFVW